jgi:Ca-activated chloride channel homolog
MFAPTVSHRQGRQARQVRCREESPNWVSRHNTVLESGPSDIKTSRLLCDGLGEHGGLGGPIGRRLSQGSIPEWRSFQTMEGGFRYHQRMPRLLFLLVILTLGSPATAASPSTIEIVLDVSAGMHRPGVGGSPFYTTIREALIAVVAEAPAARPDLLIGLRFAGGDPSADPIESCSSTRPTLPVAAVDLEAWTRTLEELEPSGFRPLISSVVAGLNDLDPTTKNRRVVVVTSGDDQCGSGPRQVAAALAASDRPAELRMVGLGLDQAVLDRFGGVPIRNATTAEGLIDALRWAVLDIEDLPRPDGRLVLRLTPDTTDIAAAQAAVVDQTTGETHPISIVAETRLDLPVGRHRLTVQPETGDHIEYRDLLVSAGVETAANLDLGPPPPVAIGIVNDSAISGAPTWIDVAGFAPPDARLLFVDATGTAVSRLAEPNDNDGWMNAPSVVGPLELLLLTPQATGGVRVIARRPVIVVSGDPGLTAPDEIGIGEDVVVSWSALVDGKDMVGVVPRDGAPTDFISCISINGRIESLIAAPTAAAELDLIVVDDVTLSVVARHPLQVSAPAATVDAPSRAATGERIEVAWFGPEGQEDFVSLAPAGSPDVEYLEWARVEDGNPWIVRIPRVPGDYELRYVDGEKGEVLARAAIEVAAVQVELKAPTTAIGGTRIEVAWTGPALAGDIITVSKPGSAPNRYIEWASITEGAPLTLAAPSKPGAYEIRYVAQNGNAVLAHIVIEVR